VLTVYIVCIGLLEKIKKNHNIVCKQVKNEVNDVNQDTVEEWKRKISGPIAGYETKDVYNADESDIFLSH
jgi:hypothetical protein